MLNRLRPVEDFYHAGSCLHRNPRPRGNALGRAPRLAPRVAYRLLVEPRVDPLVVPRDGAGILAEGLEGTVLEGCSMKEVSVVLSASCC